ncbi:hypothetical protein EYF80_033274 [Liparis tanakae]|uniref:Uncharacterized protein n=1 Tax=Liparis tanakae TaxID=230148 RepID=A0A4Z2GSA8_9TELE|nr:hypothetical protein EYF80_033274 [Liparis tanakae]
MRKILTDEGRSAELFSALATRSLRDRRWVNLEIPDSDLKMRNKGISKRLRGPLRALSHASCPSYVVRYSETGHFTDGGEQASGRP